jgi:hypothetical protein
MLPHGTMCGAQCRSLLDQAQILQRLVSIGPKRFPADLLIEIPLAVLGRNCAGSHDAPADRACKREVDIGSLARGGRRNRNSPARKSGCAQLPRALKNMLPDTNIHAQVAEGEKFASREKPRCIGIARQYSAAARVMVAHGRLPGRGESRSVVFGTPPHARPDPTRHRKMRPMQ